MARTAQKLIFERDTRVPSTQTARIGDTDYERGQAVDATAEQVKLLTAEDRPAEYQHLIFRAVPASEVQEG